MPAKQLPYAGQVNWAGQLNEAIEKRDEDVETRLTRKLQDDLDTMEASLKDTIGTEVDRVAPNAVGRVLREDEGVRQAIDAAVEPAVEEAAASLDIVTGNALSTAIGGLVAPPLTQVTITPLGATPTPVDVFDGYLWGYTTGTIHRSTTNGDTWQSYATGYPGNGLYRLMPTDDGEVLGCSPNGVYKSTGWATGGSSVTWERKVTPNGTCQMQPWSLDGNGTKFITTEYSSTRIDSRYVYISLDGGDTFNVVYDSNVRHGAKGEQSHLHGCAYDPYRDRFYISEGHDTGGQKGDIAGIYVSTDDGQTWTRAPGMAQDPGPTTITPTPDGLVCGSDNAVNGLYGVRTAANPQHEELRLVWRWNTGRAGLVGFAKRGYAQPGSRGRMVYVTFHANTPDVAPVIAAGTVDSGSLVFTWPNDQIPNGMSEFIHSAVLPTPDRILARALIGGQDYLIRGTAGQPGAAQVVDSGQILGGHTPQGDGVAVGPRASTGEAIQSLAVGNGAAVTGPQNGTAVGHGAEVIQAHGTAVGHTAKAGSTSVAVGQNADGTLSASVVLGRNAKTSGGGEGVAIGQNADSRTRAVSIGGSATSAAGSVYGVAIGWSASAHTRSVALGYDTKTTAVNQTKIGPRHIELDVAPDDFLPPDQSVRFFVRKNAETGKHEVCARFPTGTAKVIAAED